MHLKAISIKEQLLGPEDYEVALSVGHLASLYNYDMMKYDKAEQLYLRSISIGKSERGKEEVEIIFFQNHSVFGSAIWVPVCKMFSWYIRTKS